MKDIRIPFKKFNERNERLLSQYDENYYNKQHSKGKLTARERIEFLMDVDSFREIDAFVKPSGKEDEKKYGDGVIVGTELLVADKYLCLHRILLLWEVR